VKIPQIKRQPMNLRRSDKTVTNRSTSVEIQIVLNVVIGRTRGWYYFVIEHVYSCKSGNNHYQRIVL